VLSPKEALAVDQCGGDTISRTLLITLYGTGMRRAELAHLKVSDIDSQRDDHPVVPARAAKIAICL